MGCRVTQAVGHRQLPPEHAAHYHSLIATSRYDKFLMSFRSPRSENGLHHALGPQENPSSAKAQKKHFAVTSRETPSSPTRSFIIIFSSPRAKYPSQDTAARTPHARHLSKIAPRVAMTLLQLPRFRLRAYLGRAHCTEHSITEPTPSF
jgi:hypothetical protein